MPEALLNYLVRLGWSHGDQEIFTREEMIKYFTLNAVSKSASAFNTDKLLWLNHHYINALPPEYVATNLQWHIEQENIDTRNGPQLADLVKLLGERCKTLKEIRAKSGLNRSILNQGWYEMRRQLEYKQLWRGGQVLAVPPAYTSQRCACCGHTAKENRLSQSKFRFQVCGYTANADVNGARNILAAGHAVLACGEMVQSGRPLKQEPTEMIQATA